MVFNRASVEQRLPRRKAAAPAHEDSSFTVKRVHTKTQVYSGSKTAHPPRMTTLEEQCIRLLQHKVSAITELEAVPFHLLKPILERSTPVDLQRFKPKSQRFTKVMEELWMRHCRRHFKQETPREQESWRELYLRLEKEQEDELKWLTSRISSAHASKSRGRRLILVDALPLPDVGLL